MDSTLAELDVLIATINALDDGPRRDLIRDLERRFGFTLRTEAEECAVRELANLADIHAGLGFGDAASLEAACSWHYCVRLRLAAR